MSKFTDSWTDEVNNVLNRIRLNSIELSERHRVNSFESKSYRKYFDIPTIILSTMASSFAIGATRFVSQHTVSLTNCGINMFIAMLTSIKLYLNLDETFKNEQAASRAFEYLALDLTKMLRLKKEQRNCDGLEYLNKIYAEYIKLKGNSKLLSKMLKKDFLLDIDKKLLRDDDVSYGSYTPEFITIDEADEYNRCNNEKKGSIMGNIFSSPIPYVNTSVKQMLSPKKRRPSIKKYSREQIERDLQRVIENDLNRNSANDFHNYDDDTGDIEMQQNVNNKPEKVSSVDIDYYGDDRRNTNNEDTNQHTEISSTDDNKNDDDDEEIKNDIVNNDTNDNVIYNKESEEHKYSENNDNYTENNYNDVKNKKSNKRNKKNKK